MDFDPQYKTKDGSAVRIWKDAAKNNFLSDTHGRAIFDEVILVEVISPGSKGSTPIFEAERIFAKEGVEAGMPKFRRGVQYDSYAELIDTFKRAEAGEGIDGEMSGTPLSEWPAVSRTIVATMREGRIYTVEALASVPDEKLRVIGPDGRQWREKAIAFLDNAKDGAHVSKLAADLEVANADLADKDRQIAELSERITAIEAASAKTAKTAKTPESALPSIV